MRLRIKAIGELPNSYKVAPSSSSLPASTILG